MTGRSRPRVGISACLLGEPVRYDGAEKGVPEIVACLRRAVELVSVCPELELGLGVPREPIELVRLGAAESASGIGLRGVETRRELGAAMRHFAARRCEELAAAGLHGFVLKSRSPSCGLDVVVRDEAGETTAERAPGLFVEALRVAYPELPLADESELAEERARERFLARVVEFSERAEAEAGA